MNVLNKMKETLEELLKKIPTLNKNTSANGNNNHKKTFIYILTILFIILTIFYIIPDMLVMLLNSILGNSILLLIFIYLSLYKDYRVAISFIIIWIIIYRFVEIIRNQSCSNNNSQQSMAEGFQLINTTPWSDEQTQQYILLQHSIHPNMIFDAKTIQKVTSPEELAFYLKNRTWKWSPEVEELYKSNLNHNPYISTFDEDGLQYAKSIYSQGQIIQILSQQSKEGQFLLNGIILKNNDQSTKDPLEASSIFNKPEYPIIRCGASDNNPNAPLIPQEILPGNFNGQVNNTGCKTLGSDSTALYEDVKRTYNPITDFSLLPQKIPGFKFQGEPCNPCLALNMDYSCKFEIDIKENPNKNALNSTHNKAFPEIGISNVWSYIWNNIQAPQSNSTKYHLTGTGTIQ